MNRPWIGLLALALLCLPLFVPACNSSETKIPSLDDDDDDDDDSFTPACAADEDCGEGKICDQGNCVAPDDDDDNDTTDGDVPECAADEDCPGGRICIDGSCMKLCRTDTDCAAPTAFCHPDLYCVQCLFDEDCASGETCEDERCVAPVDGDEDGDTEIPTTCEGSCDAVELPSFCLDGNACVCQANGWTLFNCEDVCAFEGKPYLGCGVREGYNGLYCQCGEVDGDTTDGDETDGDTTDGDITCSPACNTDAGKYCNSVTGQCENVSCLPCDKDDDCAGGRCGDALAGGEILQRVCLGSSCNGDEDCGLGFHCAEGACLLNADARCPRLNYAGFTEVCQTPTNLDAMQCARGLRCVYVPNTQASWCSSPCQQNEDCAGWTGSCCNPLSDNQTYCVAPDYCN